MISRGFYRFLLAMSRMGSHFSGKARVGIHWGQPFPVGALTCSSPLSANSAHTGLPCCT